MYYLCPKVHPGQQHGLRALTWSLRTIIGSKTLSVAAEGPPKDRPKRGGSIAHAPALCTVEEDAPLRKMDTVDDPEHCFLHHSAAPRGFSLQRGRLGFRNTGNGHCPDPSLVLFLFPSLSLSSPHELYVTTVRGTLRGHHGQPLVIVQK